MEEVRWDKEGTVREDNCTFSMENEINHILISIRPLHSYLQIRSLVRELIH